MALPDKYTFQTRFKLGGIYRQEQTPPFPGVVVMTVGDKLRTKWRTE